MQNVLKQYGFPAVGTSIHPLGNGLINSTWVIETKGKKFVLQKINQQVFKRPEDIAFNISQLAAYLKKQHPGYLFTAAVQTVSGYDMVKEDGAYYRGFNFIHGSHTSDVL
mgnify:FL=1